MTFLSLMRQILWQVIYRVRIDKANDIYILGTETIMDLEELKASLAGTSIH